MVNAQEWLKKYYLDKEKTRIIYLNQKLEGVLDCSEYKNLQKIFISPSVNSSKLEIKKGSYKDVWGEIKGETKIIPCIPTPTYLNQKYPTLEAREKVKKLNIIDKSLEGNLDCSDFKNLEALNCQNNYLTNLNLNNCKKLKKIECHNNQLTTLDLSNLEELEELWCSNNYLTQIIYPTNPERITKLDISNNNFSKQNLSIFSQFRNLEELDIGNDNKNKINQNIYNHFYDSLEPLKDLNELRWLGISNTNIDSGAEHLPDSLEYFDYETELRPDCKLRKIKEQLEQELWKDIRKDFISSNKLLRKDWLEAKFSKEETKKWIEAGAKLYSVKFLNWFLNFKKLDLGWALENEEEFKDLRDKYQYLGTCKECKQPNTSGSWCQSCNAKQFESEFPNWTSDNLQIDKFIQKCQLEATSPWNVLEWIPYEKFRSVEYIAKGGFGKVEKAKLMGGTIWGWDNEKREWGRKVDYERSEYKDYKTVALKTLSNSQNLNQEFLKELTLYKMFKSEVSNMVPCYGVSQNPQTKEYVLVMKFMKEGSLREYLKKNYQWLMFYSGEYGESKLNFLKQIIQGLKDIHRKKLVHRDFHSGNIIVSDEYERNCHITDLGLSKPVDEWNPLTFDKGNEKDNNQVYGVMPYMAPEVLRNQPYTQKSDVYSLGMVMYEILTCLPPYAEEEHDINLALKICRGERPQFPKKIKYPQLLVDLIKQCWDSELNKRPTTREMKEKLNDWEEIFQQYIEAEEYNETLPKEVRFPNYQVKEAVWHSKPINTNEIVQQLQSECLDCQIITDKVENLKAEDKQKDQEQQFQSHTEQPPK